MKRAALAALGLYGALLAASTSTAEPPPPAAAELSAEALDPAWSVRLSEAQERQATAAAHVADAQQALGSARHRKRPRGASLAALEGELARAQRERAAADAELPELLEQARRAGVSPGVLRRFEPEDE